MLIIMPMNISSVFDAYSIFEKLVSIIFLALHATDKKKIINKKETPIIKKRKKKIFFPERIESTIDNNSYVYNLIEHPLHISI